MDSLFGVAGDGFVVLAADAQVARSILLYQNDLDKIKELDSHKMMALAGPQADCNLFGEYIQKNMALYELNNDLRLSTKAAANYIRRELATALRKGPYQVNMLMGGVDAGAAALYWLDYLGTLQPVKYGAQGYGAAFTLSLLDRSYRVGMAEADAVELVRSCIAALHKRFLIAQPNFVIKVVDKDGIRVLK
ncbi:nucleophile aminohydrolase [Tribonema minus]|uniref:Proteasome subunit beta n=1 Tax=Tribonema minus TaxID=303371 RepID=A0A836CPT6_9STRA|nr:nucleophile aminohydrolase [Tribonema minus]